MERHKNDERQNQVQNGRRNEGSMQKKVPYRANRMMLRASILPDSEGATQALPQSSITSVGRTSRNIVETSHCGRNIRETKQSLKSSAVISQTGQNIKQSLKFRSCKTVTNSTRSKILPDDAVVNTHQETESCPKQRPSIMKPVVIGPEETLKNSSILSLSPEKVEVIDYSYGANVTKSFGGFMDLDLDYSKTVKCVSKVGKKQSKQSDSTRSVLPENKPKTSLFSNEPIKFGAKSCPTIRSSIVYEPPTRKIIRATILEPTPSETVPKVPIQMPKPESQTPKIPERQHFNEHDTFKSSCDAQRVSPRNYFSDTDSETLLNLRQKKTFRKPAKSKEAEHPGNKKRRSLTRLRIDDSSEDSVDFECQNKRKSIMKDFTQKKTSVKSQKRVTYADQSDECVDPVPTIPYFPLMRPDDAHPQEIPSENTQEIDNIMSVVTKKLREYKHASAIPQEQQNQHNVINQSEQQVNDLPIDVPDFSSSVDTCQPKDIEQRHPKDPMRAKKNQAIQRVPYQQKVINQSDKANDESAELPTEQPGLSSARDTCLPKEIAIRTKKNQSIRREPNQNKVINQNDRKVNDELTVSPSKQPGLILSVDTCQPKDNEQRYLKDTKRDKKNKEGQREQYKKVISQSDKEGSDATGLSKLIEQRGQNNPRITKKSQEGQEKTCEQKAINERGKEVIDPPTVLTSAVNTNKTKGFEEQNSKDSTKKSSCEPSEAVSEAQTESVPKRSRGRPKKKTLTGGHKLVKILSNSKPPMPTEAAQTPVATKTLETRAVNDDTFVRPKKLFPKIKLSFGKPNPGFVANPIVLSKKPVDTSKASLTIQNQQNEFEAISPREKEVVKDLSPVRSKSFQNESQPNPCVLGSPDKKQYCVLRSLLTSTVFVSPSELCKQPSVSNINEPQSCKHAQTIRSAGRPSKRKHGLPMPIFAKRLCLVTLLKQSFCKQTYSSEELKEFDEYEVSFRKSLESKQNAKGVTEHLESLSSLPTDRTLFESGDEIMVMSPSTEQESTSKESKSCGEQAEDVEEQVNTSGRSFTTAIVHHHSQTEEKDIDKKDIPDIVATGDNLCSGTSKDLWTEASGMSDHVLKQACEPLHSQACQKDTQCRDIFVESSPLSENDRLIISLEEDENVDNCVNETSLEFGSISSSDDKEDAGLKSSTRMTSVETSPGGLNEEEVESIDTELCLQDQESNDYYRNSNFEICTGESKISLKSANELGITNSFQANLQPTNLIKSDVSLRSDMPNEEQDVFNFDDGNCVSISEQLDNVIEMNAIPTLYQNQNKSPIGHVLENHFNDNIDDNDVVQNRISQAREFCVDGAQKPDCEIGDTSASVQLFSPIGSYTNLSDDQDKADIANLATELESEPVSEDLTKSLFTPPECPAESVQLKLSDELHDVLAQYRTEVESPASEVSSSSNTSNLTTLPWTSIEIGPETSPCQLALEATRLLDSLLEDIPLDTVRSQRRKEVEELVQEVKEPEEHGLGLKKNGETWSIPVNISLRFLDLSSIHAKANTNSMYQPHLILFRLSLKEKMKIGKLRLRSVRDNVWKLSSPSIWKQQEAVLVKGGVPFDTTDFGRAISRPSFKRKKKRKECVTRKTFFLDCQPEISKPTQTKIKDMVNVCKNMPKSKLAQAILKKKSALTEQEENNSQILPFEELLGMKKGSPAKKEQKRIPKKVRNYEKDSYGNKRNPLFGSGSFIFGQSIKFGELQNNQELTETSASTSKYGVKFSPVVEYGSPKETVQQKVSPSRGILKLQTSVNTTSPYLDLNVDKQMTPVPSDDNIADTFEPDWDEDNLEHDDQQQDYFDETPQEYSHPLGEFAKCQIPEDSAKDILDNQKGDVDECMISEEESDKKAKSSSDQVVQEDSAVELAVEDEDEREPDSSDSEIEEDGNEEEEEEEKVETNDEEEEEDKDDDADSVISLCASTGSSFLDSEVEEEETKTKSRGPAKAAVESLHKLGEIDIVEKNTASKCKSNNSGSRKAALITQDNLMVEDMELSSETECINHESKHSSLSNMKPAEPNMQHMNKVADSTRHSAPHPPRADSVVHMDTQQSTLMNSRQVPHGVSQMNPAGGNSVVLQPSARPLAPFSGPCPATQETPEELYQQKAEADLMSKHESMACEMYLAIYSLFEKPFSWEIFHRVILHAIKENDPSLLQKPFLDYFQKQKVLWDDWVVKQLSFVLRCPLLACFHQACHGLMEKVFNIIRSRNLRPTARICLILLQSFLPREDLLNEAVLYLTRLGFMIPDSILRLVLCRGKGLQIFQFLSAENIRVLGSQFIDKRLFQYCVSKELKRKMEEARAPWTLLNQEIESESTKEVPPLDVNNEDYKFTVHRINGCCHSQNWSYLASIYLEQCTNPEHPNIHFLNIYVRVLHEKNNGKTAQYFSDFVNHLFLLYSKERDEDQLLELDRLTVARIGFQLMLLFRKMKEKNTAFSILKELMTRDLPCFVLEPVDLECFISVAIDVCQEEKAFYAYRIVRDYYMYRRGAQKPTDPGKWKKQLLRLGYNLRTQNFLPQTLEVLVYLNKQFDLTDNANFKEECSLLFEAAFECGQLDTAISVFDLNNTGLKPEILLDLLEDCIVLRLPIQNEIFNKIRVHLNCEQNKTYPPSFHISEQYVYSVTKMLLEDFLRNLYYWLADRVSQEGRSPTSEELAVSVFGGMTDYVCHILQTHQLCVRKRQGKHVLIDVDSLKHFMRNFDMAYGKKQGLFHTRAPPSRPPPTRPPPTRQPPTRRPQGYRSQKQR